MIDPGTLIALYARLDPRDRRDARWIMRKETMEEIARKYDTSDVSPKILPVGNSILGIRVEIDDNMPIGTVRLNVESALERSVRRLREEGVTTVNIVRMPDLAPEIIRPPDPTLRALIRHWLRGVRRG